MSGDSHTTTDHDVIRKWAEERGDRPASVAGTGGREPGILRIEFPGQGSEDSLDQITREEFFRKFEENRLAFLYQETLKDGHVSRFFKFISRE